VQAKVLFFRIILKIDCFFIILLISIKFIEIKIEPGTVQKLNLGIQQMRINFGPRNANDKEIYKDYQDKLHTRGRLRTTLYTNIFRSLPQKREGFFILTLFPEKGVFNQKNKTKGAKHESCGCRCHWFSGYQNVTGIGRA
jgi:hypothetical protein